MDYVENIIFRIEDVMIVSCQNIDFNSRKYTSNFTLLTVYMPLKMAYLTLYIFEKSELESSIY